MTKDGSKSYLVLRTLHDNLLKSMQNKLLLRVLIFVKPSTGFCATCLHASAAVIIYALHEANGKYYFR
jgi:hypothetical protein